MGSLSRLSVYLGSPNLSRLSVFACYRDLAAALGPGLMRSATK